MKYEFEIKEKAIGKERPRKGKCGKFYTPDKTKNFEELVKWSFTSKYNIATQPSTKPFGAMITVIYKPAESLSNKKKEELIKSFWHTKKPDADNIAKSILDALNGLAYKDDSQVSALTVIKNYGLEDKIYVEMEEIN